MLRVVFHIAFVTLLLASPSHAGDWTFAGVPSAATGTFTATGTNGKTIVFNTTRNFASSGLIKSVVAASSSGDASHGCSPFNAVCPANGAILFFQEAVGFSLFHEKMTTDDTQVVIAVAKPADTINSACPGNVWTGNWIMSIWPSSGFTMTSNAFPSYGTFSWDPTTQKVDICAWVLNNGLRLGCYTGASAIPATCSAGTVTLRTGNKTYDQDGVLTISAAGGGIYKTYQRNTFLQPTSSIPANGSATASALDGQYNGFAYDNSGVVTRFKMTMATAANTITGSGGTFIDTALTEDTDIWRMTIPQTGQNTAGDATYAPNAGFMRGTFDYQPAGGSFGTARPVVCTVYINTNTSIFCITQDKSDATKPMSFTLVSTGTSSSGSGSDSYSYGTGGATVTTTALAGDFGYAKPTDVKVLPDGRILLLSMAAPGINVDPNGSATAGPGILRFGVDGKLDLNFGMNTLGCVASSVNAATPCGTAYNGSMFVAGISTQTLLWGITGGSAMDNLGRIYMVGSRGVVGAQRAAVARFTSNGVIDSAGYAATATYGTTYGTMPGMILTGYSATSSGFFGVAIDASNRAVVVGQHASDATQFFNWMVMRFTTDGGLDASFDSDGKQQGRFWPATNTGYSERLSVVQIQADGKIVAAGNAWDGATTNSQSWNAIRLLTNGALDTTWGVAGYSNLSITGGTGMSNDVGGLPMPATAPAAMVLDASGRAVIGGFKTGTDKDVVIARLGTNGIVDSSFNGTGIYTASIGTTGGKDDGILGLAITTAGKIVGAGFADHGAVVANNVERDVLVIRLTSAGVLDTTFATGGKYFGSINATEERAVSIYIQSDGKYLLGVRTQTASGAMYRSGTMRIWP